MNFEQWYFIWFESILKTYMVLAGQGFKVQESFSENVFESCTQLS